MRAASLSRVVQSVIVKRRHPALSWVPRKVVREGLVFEQHIHEGRFQRSLAFITGMSAILGGLEVTYEHYRGSYGTRVMYTPVLLTPALVGASAWTVFHRRGARTALLVVSALVIVDGLVGTFFHLRGIRRKPGGWRVLINNVVMGPPFLAPLLFALPGYLGLISSFLRREDDPRFSGLPLRRFGQRRLARYLAPWRQDVREGRFQKHLAVATAVSSVCSGVEALYSHYKNNFRYKAQWTPVVIAPVLAATGIVSVFSRRAARTWLPAVSLLAIADGAVGSAYHLRGLLRRPGGTKHLVYNVMYGPPIFAPLLFAGAGFMGVLASLMRRER